MFTDRLMYFRAAEDTLLYRFSNLLIKEEKDEVLKGNHLGTIVNNPAEDKLFSCLHELIEFGTRYGYEGNLWQMYLTDFLINSENEYTKLSERHGKVEGTAYDIVKNDAEIMIRLFDIDLEIITRRYSYPITEIVRFKADSKKKGIYDESTVDAIHVLCEKLAKSKDTDEFLLALNTFYKDFGVGTLGLHKAFRVDDSGNLYPVSKIANVSLSDLIGYDEQKQMLLDNTRCFVEDKPANNCLLYGEAGTGKSTSIKAITNQFYKDGIRTIEIYKHQFRFLNDIMASLKNRHYKFLLYMDDLSFEDFEIEYKYLKAVIEGGLEERPKNILIYATSNRRHLIRESFKDKDDRDELHKNDTVQEKLSLYNRFGVTIYYGSPNKKEFNEIVKALRTKAGLELSDDEILKEANIWELHHGGLSGRTARQFIDYMIGKTQT